MHVLSTAERALKKGSPALGKFYVVTDGDTHTHSEGYGYFWDEIDKSIVSMGACAPPVLPLLPSLAFQQQSLPRTTLLHPYLVAWLGLIFLWWVLWCCCRMVFPRCSLPCWLGCFPLLSCCAHAGFTSLHDKVKLPYWVLMILAYIVSASVLDPTQKMCAAMPSVRPVALPLLPHVP